MCLLYSLAHGQNNIYFNKFFNLDTLTTTSGACSVLQNGYLFCGVCNNPNDASFKQGFYFRTTDLYGETIDFNVLNYEEGITWIISGGNLMETVDGNLLIAASKTYSYTGVENDIILVKFNPQLGVLWKKILDQPGTSEHPYQVIPTSDAGYIMAGVQRSPGQNNRFYVLKTDNLGNEEWSSQYHPLQHGSAFSIYETDTGYVVSGYMQYPDTNTDMFIMEINKQGELLWDKHYGGDEIDNACLLLPNSAINNTYFVASAVRENTVSKPFVALIDSVGETIWSKVIEQPIGALQEAPLQPTPDGGFVCLYSYDTEYGYRAPWFWRFTATGDTLWTRRIPGAPSNNNTYLKDIAPTHDGGWVLSGFNYSQQSSWVVKTDSLGHTCSFIGCDSTVVVEVLPGIPQLFEGGELQIYPVPAATHLYIRYQIPAAVSPSGNAVWRLYNALGRQVAEAALPGNVGTEQVSVAHLPAGIYYYWVVFPASGQTVASGKVVVE
ncbi:hypothetical protein C7N43_37940 [Sphingobacteriales bacterium UPWRP_1]|nr:hypothetical protein C7N43_37940 [Sphingobacteriales bacterium UPWRP_1]